MWMPEGTDRMTEIRNRSLVSAGMVAPVFLATAILLIVAGCREERHGAQPAEGPADTRNDASPAAPAEQEAPAVRPIINPPADPLGCLAAECHEAMARVTYRHMTFQSGACTECHTEEQEGHKFPLLRTGAKLCTNCHDRIGHKAFVHDVIKKEGCLGCHDPHGSNAPFFLVSPSLEVTCNRCHPIERKAVRHAPFAAGQCTSCHDAHEADNEHLLLGGEGEEHCYVCHGALKERVEQAAHVHPPVQQDGCVSCHDPHSSDGPALLQKGLDETCFECHQDIERATRHEHNQHGALLTGRRCANCHDGHASQREALLRDEQKALCLSCHDKPVQAYDGHTIPDMRPAVSERKFLHGPVRTGQCSACHDVHGSDNGRLLRAAFPTKFYEAFDFTNYALCFQCHNSGIVLQEDTKTLTDFRNGRKNLHYVHVNRRKGRTCRTCHEMHGSDRPKHMAGEVPFEGGGWAMPIRFEETETGGRCSPGCHGTREYVRGAEGNAP